MAQKGARLVNKREKLLDAALARAMADIEAGRVRPAEDIFAELKDRYKRLVGRTYSARLQECDKLRRDLRRG
ncbi:hypothetical protein [Rhizobium sullae]|uniref:Uncharacterized protein n=1 Tax=Rhizobium sullae TaxID=50338 RepID=A0A4R3Q874_RHISU|nr:hypothetical protein [Rhizobium sullae]TCU17421.1 hypothetical protein EV132_104454 [Rhizobium sullae]